MLLGADFVGATLGIVGVGRIGQAVAKRATGFDMRIVYYDPGASPPDPSTTAISSPPLRENLPSVSTDMETLLREFDFTSVHVPLTPETHHLVYAEFLSRLKPNSVLINTPCGGVLDQDALYQILKKRRIFATALDVTDPEPLPLVSPLRELDNCNFVPHIASASVKSRDLMAFLSAKNLIAGVSGERLPHGGSPEVYS
jgi:glyoxylate reductase